MLWWTCTCSVVSENVPDFDYGTYDRRGLAVANEAPLVLPNCVDVHDRPMLTLRHGIPAVPAAARDG
jgi:hypothetical protein